MDELEKKAKLSALDALRGSLQVVDDRIKQDSNPNMYGPEAPNMLPVEQEFNNDIAQAAIGSLTSGMSPGKLPAQRAENIEKLNVPQYTKEKYDQVMELYKQLANRPSIDAATKSAANIKLNAFLKRFNKAQLKD